MRTTNLLPAGGLTAVPPPAHNLQESLLLLHLHPYSLDKLQDGAPKQHGRLALIPPHAFGSWPTLQPANKLQHTSL
jgi:hypothetical protein